MVVRLPQTPRPLFWYLEDDSFLKLNWTGCCHSLCSCSQTARQLLLRRQQVRFFLVFCVYLWQGTILPSLLVPDRMLILTKKLFWRCNIQLSDNLSPQIKYNATLAKMDCDQVYTWIVIRCILSSTSQILLPWGIAPLAPSSAPSISPTRWSMLLMLKWNELIEGKFQILETEVNLGDFCHKDMSARQFFRQQVRETW